MQPKYFVIDGLAHLFQLSQQDLIAQADLARQSGLLPPLFEPKEATHAE